MADALRLIVDPPTCVLNLAPDSPINPAYLTLLDGSGQTIDRSLWTFMAPGVVTYRGSLCEAVKTSTYMHPVVVTVRYAQPL